MEKKIKGNTYGDWMIFWFLVILAIGSVWGGIPKSEIGFFFAAILWLAVIFEIFYISNKKKKTEFKKIKSKERHNKENEIAGYLIIFFLGLFVWVFAGWIILLAWWMIGFFLVNLLIKKLKK